MPLIGRYDQIIGCTPLIGRTLVGKNQLGRFEGSTTNKLVVQDYWSYVGWRTIVGCKFDEKMANQLYCQLFLCGGGVTTNPEAVLSRTGFVISYAGCPIYWGSRLQTEIALSTTEAEYIALSVAMHEVLPFLNLMEEMRNFLPVRDDEPKFFCKVWEDNRSCIKVAESPKFTPRTKHIALKYHHFRRFVSDGTVNIFPINTLEQTAYIFTKPLDTPQFVYLRKKLCEW